MDATIGWQMRVAAQTITRRERGIVSPLSGNSLHPNGAFAVGSGETGSLTLLIKDL